MDHNPQGRLRKTTIEGFSKGWRKDMNLSNYLTLGLLPTPTARESGWRHLEIVDKRGQVPRHFNQRFYNKKTGRLVQKGLSGLLAMGMLPTPSATSDAKGGCTRSDPKRQKDTLACAIRSEERRVGNEWVSKSSSGLCQE